VADAGVAWSDETLASEIGEGLRREGFVVHHPIEPPSAPPLRVEVKVLGSEGSVVAWGILGAAVIGYFFFLPSLVWPFFDNYGTKSTVRVLEHGQEIHRFEVEAKATVTHALFADANHWREEVRSGVFRDLSTKIATEVAAVRR
jgi:hypothetical protein